MVEQLREGDGTEAEAQAEQPASVGHESGQRHRLLSLDLLDVRIADHDLDPGKILRRVHLHGVDKFLNKNFYLKNDWIF